LDDVRYGSLVSRKEDGKDIRGGQFGIADCAELVKKLASNPATVRNPGCDGKYFAYELSGYCNCPRTSNCDANYDEGAVGKHRGEAKGYLLYKFDTAAADGSCKASGDLGADGKCKTTCPSDWKGDDFSYKYRGCRCATGWRGDSCNCLPAVDRRLETCFIASCSKRLQHSAESDCAKNGSVTTVVQGCLRYTPKVSSLL